MVIAEATAEALAVIACGIGLCLLVWGLRPLQTLIVSVDDSEGRHWWKLVQRAVFIPILVAYMIAIYAINNEDISNRLLIGAFIFFLLPLFTVLLLELAVRAVKELKQSQAEKTLAESELALHRTKALEKHRLVAIGQLAGGLAHDFNNLLSIVIGNLDEVKENVSGSDSRAQRQIDSALAASLRGAEVTRSLLSVAGQRPQQSLEYDVNELVQEIMPLVNIALGSDVTSECTYSDFRLVGNLNATGFDNALLNLANNARDAMKLNTDKKLFKVDTNFVTVEDYNNIGYDGLEAGHYAVITVSDSGEGMDEETLRKIFRPFFTTKDVDEGTGLGMSMVHDYMEEMGGAIKVSSEVGSGTVISLYLPLNTSIFLRQQVDEDKRLSEVEGTGMAESTMDTRFDKIVDEASKIFDGCAAALCLLGDEKIYVKSSIRFPIADVDRHGSPAGYVVAHGQPLIVTDASSHPVFNAHPDAKSDNPIRFWVGVPVINDRNYALGVLCVFDSSKHADVTNHQLEQLKLLAKNAMQLIDGRRHESVVSDFDQPIDASMVTTSRAVECDPYSVLVVDDEQDLAKLAAMWLSSFGWKVSICLSAVQALRHLSDNPCAVLFTDVVMPGDIDGIELAQEAKKMQPNIQILLASGHSDRLRQESHLPGQFISKPYRKSDLIDAIGKLSDE